MSEKPAGFRVSRQTRIREAGMDWQAAAVAATIFVRCFNNFGVPAEDLAGARTHVDAVFQQAGVRIVWADCWVRDRQPSGAPARCLDPVGHDIMLRLHRGGDAGRSRFASMGFSLVNSQDAPVLATVFVDRVDSVARLTRADRRRLLGLAIAHEIGHVLLNTNSHAQDGLMRADWTQSELRNTTESWTFGRTQSAEVRAAARQRDLPRPSLAGASGDE